MTIGHDRVLCWAVLCLFQFIAAWTARKGQRSAVEFHRIPNNWGWKESLRIIYSKALLKALSTQDCAQQLFEQFQGWRLLTCLSQQPVPVFDPLHIQRSFFWYLHGISCVPSLDNHRKKDCLSFLKSPHHVFMHINKGPLSVFFIRMNNPGSLCLSQGWRWGRGAHSSPDPAFSLSWR